MLSLLSWAKFPNLGFAFIFFASTLIFPKPSTAQERYPTVARISFVSGPVTYSRGDDPGQWDDAIENVPLTIGDRIYSPENGRAELQLSSGNFVRLAPRSYFSALNLSDDIKQFYLGEGAASFDIKRLRSDEVIEIDTPNVSVTFDEPGIYRITVDEDGNSRISARRGRVTVAASGRQIAVENREIRVYGIDSPRYEFVGLPVTDTFDRWVAERDHRFERNYADAYRYASDEIIGVGELSDYGRWEQIPEYGYAWTPTNVVAGWVPFSDGRWFWQDPWGWTWISNDRWGWATSHYGRWTPYRSRWYWVPVRPRTRVIYAPACVEFVRVRDNVGWFPLHPRDRFIPWWERDDRRPIQNITYVNRTYVTVVNQNTFISARPIDRHIVRDSVIVREAGSARLISDSLPIPSRSSLRVVSEAGERRNHRPSDRVLARAAVVRTAPPPAPATFQEKLPEIQKRQGRPLEPSTVAALSSQTNETRRERVRIRPAAAESGGDFAPRTPGVASGPAPQPLTAARGKKLATRENAADTSERAERAEKSSAQQQPLQAFPPEASKGIAGKPESPRPEQDRDRQRQEKQEAERERRAQQEKQQELERRQQQQQKEQERQAREQQKQQREVERRQQEQERKAELQKQQQDQERREQQKQQQVQERQTREQQKQEEAERRQQARQREEERKAQLQQRQQEEERRQQLRQQELQERQGRERQRQQELERRQQQQQKEQERETQLQQKQQDQLRREQLRQQQLQDRQAQQQRGQEQERAQQLRQQQLQERQAREQQRQQELERRQQQQQREQDRNAQLQQRQQEQIRREQLRQQQVQQQQRRQELDRRQPAQQTETDREAQLQRQQEQARRQQLRHQQLQDRQAQPL